MKKFKKPLFIVLGILLLVQFIPANLPEVKTLNENSFDQRADVPDDIKTLIRNACFDCHSNGTKSP